MSASTVDLESLQPLLPESIVGQIKSIEPIRMGLSGAGVYGVVSATGAYVLRLQGSAMDESFWRQHLLVLERAAEMGVAPPLVHVDERARAIVSRRVNGVPLAAALANPEQREAAIRDVVVQIRALHQIDPDGVAERDAVAFARAVWETQRERAGFPTWALDIGSVFDKLAALLARDRRRVVSHNDVNPGNVLWDGTRTWLVDWEVAGLGHPYYDLAAFITFLNLDAEHGYALLALQEQSSIDDEARATFTALRQFVALLVGYMSLSGVPDLSIAATRSRDDAPTMLECRAAMRAGTLDLQTPQGRAMFGLTFLRIGTQDRD